VLRARAAFGHSYSYPWPWPLLGCCPICCRLYRSRWKRAHGWLLLCHIQQLPYCIRGLRLHLRPSWQPSHSCQPTSRTFIVVLTSSCWLEQSCWRHRTELHYQQAPRAMLGSLGCRQRPPGLGSIQTRTQFVSSSPREPPQVKAGRLSAHTQGGRGGQPLSTSRAAGQQSQSLRVNLRPPPQPSHAG